MVTWIQHSLVIDGSEVESVKFVHLAFGTKRDGISQRIFFLYRQNRRCNFFSGMYVFLFFSVELLKKSVKSLILNFVSDFQTSTCLVTIELILAGKIFCEVAEKPF